MAAKGPKMKSHKGCRKRFKVSARGKVTHRKSGKGHLMLSKTAKQRRGLRRLGSVEGADAKLIRRLIGK